MPAAFFPLVLFLNVEAKWTSACRAIRARVVGRHRRILKVVRQAPWRPGYGTCVSNGVVDLWGITETSTEKKAMGVAAENTPGVKC